MNDPKVIAVVVTYNRCALLPRCLDALMGQGAPVAEIIVIDNASTDGTREMLAARYAGRVTPMFMAHNTGGAGGFHQGVAAATERAPDWIWLMDDDGYPEPDTLARMLARSDGYGMLNPLVVAEGEPDRLAFGIRLGGRLTTCRVAVEEGAASGVIPDEMNPFNGTLVRAELIARHGNIKPEMFLWGDEVEFALRMLAAGVRMGTVVDAAFNHPVNRRAVVDLGRIGTVSDCPPAVSHVFYRNSGYYTLRYRGVVSALGKLGVYTGFLLARGRLAEVAKLWAYYADGLSGRYALAPTRDELLSRLGPAAENA